MAATAVATLRYWRHLGRLRKPQPGVSAENDRRLRVTATDWVIEQLGRGPGVKAVGLDHIVRLTVGEWSDKWLDGYRTRRKSTVRQAERYTYGGQRARGISLFAASSAVDELAVLESKLRSYAKYRRVLGVELAEIAVLLPTFQAPHWTGLFQPPGGARRPQEELLSDLLDILGPVLDNPRYVPDRSRRR